MIGELVELIGELVELIGELIELIGELTELIGELVLLVTHNSKATIFVTNLSAHMTHRRRAVVVLSQYRYQHYSQHYQQVTHSGV